MIPSRTTKYAWMCLGLSLATLPHPSSAGDDTPPDHWSLQLVRRPEPPTTSFAHLARNPIDHFIFAELEQRGLSPAAPADRRTLARRWAATLTGLPLPPERIEQFLADPNPDAERQLVDELLDSPAYGERWARHWLDVIGWAETNGFEVNTPRPNAWPYRDWVIDAINHDLPYSEFLFRQLAGDTVDDDAATGFLVAGPWDAVKSPDVKLTREQRDGELHDMVRTVSGAFLGLTVGCAKCHDHKFDPVSQVDYFGMRALLEGVQHGERPLRTPDEAKRLAEAELIRADLLAVRRDNDALEPRSRGDLVTIDDWSARTDYDGPTEPRFVALRAPTGRSPLTRFLPAEQSKRAIAPSNVGATYAWWQDVAQVDVAAYYPMVEGQYEVWLSWGCGWHTHASDALYQVDQDGDLATTEDRIHLARIDQRADAHGDGGGLKTPCWSGFRLAGYPELTEQSAIVVRAGDRPAVVTADAIVLRQRTTAPFAPGPPPTRPPLRAPVSALGNVDRFAPFHADAVRFTVQASNTLEPCIDELEVFAYGGNRNVALAAGGAVPTASSEYPNSTIHKIAHINDGQFGNGRSWISHENGAGWVQIEFARTEEVDRIAWARDREGRYSDRLATRYQIELRAPDGSWHTVASSADRAAFDPARPAGRARVADHLRADEAASLAHTLAAERKLEARLAELTRRRSVYAGRFDQQPGPTHRLFRGDPMQPREAVPPATPAELQPRLELAANATDADRRVALAHWLNDPAHPLTARVLVNRLWHHHFGRGLVATPSDLGATGSAPTHPELLDWLASEFIASGGSWKAMHRLLCSSYTYRQSSSPDPAALEIDGTTTWLWRFPPRRFEAEAIHDSMLAVAGVLNPRRGGPGYSPFEPNDNYVRVYRHKTRFGPDEWRRMIYETETRMEQDATFGVFDTPDAALSCPRRARSTTPLQALSLLNSPFVLQVAEEFGERLDRECGNDPVCRVERAFQLALQRMPDPIEHEAGQRLVIRHGSAALARALLNASEFLYVE